MGRIGYVPGETWRECSRCRSPMVRCERLLGGSELSPLRAPDRWWVPLRLLAWPVALSGLAAQFWVMVRLLELASRRGLSATLWPALGLATVAGLP